MPSSAKALRKTTYRLYPTPRQAEGLRAMLVMHQQVYNAALEERIDCYRKTGQSISYADQCRSLTEARRALPELEAINCSSLQMTLRRLNQAYAAFFRRVKAGQTPGFPRFKSLARYPGFSFKNHGDGWRFTPGQDWRHGTLRLSGVGHLRARGQARQGGEVKASEILHRDGRWYLSLTLDIGTPVRDRLADGALAYDWGVETFLTGLDHRGDEVRVENPRWWQSEKDRITALQRSVSRKTNKRSNRRRKAVRRLAAARGQLARRRLDWLHQTSAQLAQRYALVASEELGVSNMTRSAAGSIESPGRNVDQKAGLNREILDTAPAMFTSLLRLKVQETGGEFRDAPTRTLKPSQRCPACWSVAKKSLAQRTHQCGVCGHTETRDLASARVVLRWALGDQAFTNGREPADTDWPVGLDSVKPHPLRQHRAG